MFFTFSVRLALKMHVKLYEIRNDVTLLFEENLYVTYLFFNIYWEGALKVVLYSSHNDTFSLFV